MSDDFERMPPHDRAAEECVLGGMLLSKDAIADVSAVIGPQDHFLPAHQVIHEAILELGNRGKPVDPVTVANLLTATRMIGKVGGPPYLHTLIARVPIAASAGYYAQIVRELSVRRHLIEAGTRIAQAGWTPGTDLAERVEVAYRTLDEAAGTVAPGGARSVADLVGPVLEALEKGPEQVHAVRSGWSDLDGLVPGFRPGEMITVGGRPGMGKSVVMLNIAVRAGVMLNLPVLVCTLEMSAEECIERILAFEGEVDLRKIRARLLDDRDWDRLGGAYSRLVGAGNLMIDDDPYMSVQTIRSDLRAMSRAGHPAELVVVDYLGLMGKRGKSESREREVSEISRGLKLLAKEFKVPILVGSQLNRGPEMRSDHRPLPADLRDSGSVEQDSDIVILLYREDAYEQETARAGEIDLIVAKNRQGPLGTATLAFRGHYAMCGEMYRPDEDDGQAYPRSVA